MRIAWSKGTETQHALAKCVEEVYDLDTGRSVDEQHRRVYLVDEEAGFLEKYKENERGQAYLIWEENNRVAAWERLYGRFKIVWKSDMEQVNQENPMADPNFAWHVQVLARTMWGEARGHGRPEMEAVAHVVLNRVAKPRWWGSTIGTVCLSPGQFSCWNDDDPNSSKIQMVSPLDEQFRDALDVAESMMLHRPRDPTNGATHYHAHGIRPDWSLSLPKVAETEAHLFYRED